MKISILLAEEYSIALEGLRVLIATQEDMEVVGATQNGHELVRMAQELCPDVALLDFLMRPLNGIEATRQILRHNPSIKVLIWSCSSEPAHAQQAMAAGAAGYISKRTTGPELFAAIREVREGHAFLTPAISRHLHRHNQKAANNPLCRRRTNHLTTRESQVLELIAQGHTNKAMADSLMISIKTIEKHRQTLMAKTDLHEIAGLTRYAIAMGII